MSEFRPHTGLASCTCVQCDMINCGAIDRYWPGWKDVEFAGWARVVMMQIVGQPPVLWGGPKTRWMGCLDWFRVMGEALDFEVRERDEGDEDEPLA